MARTAILGRSGMGKSWFGGKVLEDVLTNGDGSGRAGRCGCGTDDCDHEAGDDDYIPTVETGEGAPDFDIDEDFEYAIHVDLEDEEKGFSDPVDLILLTYSATPDNIKKFVKFEGEVPSYIPEDELKDGDEILLPKWVFYKYKYIRVVPDGLTDEESKILVEMLADAAMKAGDTHFSLDEAHLIASKHGIGDKLMRLVTGGRKRGVEWLFMTQRPQKLHEDILSQTDYTVYFNLRGRDRDKAAEKAESIPNAEDKIDALEPRAAIIEDFDRGEYEEFSTEDLERSIEHVSGDDGKADSAYESLMGIGSDEEDSDDTDE
jgi:hypothetical protein